MTRILIVFDGVHWTVQRLRSIEPVPARDELVYRSDGRLAGPQKSLAACSAAMEELQGATYGDKPARKGRPKRKRT